MKLSKRQAAILKNLFDQVGSNGMAQIVACRELEKGITENYNNFGGDGKITVSDATREIAKVPEVLETLDLFIEILNSGQELEFDETTN